jgi:hypothetical protein
MIIEEYGPGSMPYFMGFCDFAPPLRHQLTQRIPLGAGEVLTGPVAIRQCRTLEQLLPALDHLIQGPGFCGVAIDEQDKVIMIRHQGVATAVNRETAGKFFEPIQYPLTSMVMVLVGERIITTEKGPLHATAHAVVVGSIV